jgi:hypothetical protein
LDGGHIIYTLIGKRSRYLFMPIILGFGFLILMNNDLSWLLWVFLLMFVGRYHAVPLDDVTPLSGKRRLLGILAMVIFILTFIPRPIEVIGG